MDFITMSNEHQILLERLASLKQDRIYREMSDDYFYTNGMAKAYDLEIRDVERQLELLKQTALPKARPVPLND